ncbi:9749_t:CDS:1, partial [Diversispora eburnea]
LLLLLVNFDVVVSVVTIITSDIATNDVAADSIISNLDTIVINDSTPVLITITGL